MGINGRNNGAMKRSQAKPKHANVKLNMGRASTYPELPTYIGGHGQKLPAR